MNTTKNFQSCHTKVHFSASNGFSFVTVGPCINVKIFSQHGLEYMAENTQAWCFCKKNQSVCQNYCALPHCRRIARISGTIRWLLQDSFIFSTAAVQELICTCVWINFQNLLCQGCGLEKENSVVEGASASEFPTRIFCTFLAFAIVRLPGIQPLMCGGLAALDLCMDTCRKLLYMRNHFVTFSATACCY